VGQRSAAPKKNYIPDEVAFRTKQEIALEQIDRALGHGIRVAAWTFDELYGRDHKFLDGREERKQTFVAEVPVDFHGWVRKPHVLRKGPETGHGRGRPKKYPGLARQIPSSEVRTLVKYSPSFRKQSWQRYRVKDTDKGPEVWEVKWAVFWRKQESGLPGRRHCLIAAHNVLTGEMKYFVANRVPGEGGVTLRWLLRVAFGRWPVEQCFREAKDELGMDHYQVRGWRCVHRHFYITQASHLFCARIRLEYGEPVAAQPGCLPIPDAPPPGQHDRLGRDRLWLGDTPPRLTVPQVRGAMNAWLDAADMTPQARKQRYQAELDNIGYHQRRNEQARRSHTKTTIATLKALGIDPEKIKSCIPDDP
jgi:SRSO17 transposase